MANLNDKPKTFGIGVRDIRPCDACGGKLLPAFHHIQVRDAVIDLQNARSFLGTVEILGGPFNPGAAAVAEVMAPGTNEIATVLDQPITIYLCSKCLASADALCVALERRKVV